MHWYPPHCLLYTFTTLTEVFQGPEVFTGPLFRLYLRPQAERVVQLQEVCHHLLEEMEVARQCFEVLQAASQPTS